MRALGPALLVLTSFGVGCGDNLVGAPPLGYVSRAPNSSEPVAGYPAAPDEGYGGEEGEILPNMAFSGYFTIAPDQGRVVESEYRETITLQDIRELDQYSHMLLTVAAEWCKPCREEAEILPERFDIWSQSGGYVLGVIDQDRNYNTADQNAVIAWGSRYNTNYTLTHDPQGWIADQFNPSTKPVNVVIDLRTMEVLRARVGEDRDTFRFFEEQLSN